MDLLLHFYPFTRVLKSSKFWLLSLFLVHVFSIHGADTLPENNTDLQALLSFKALISSDPLGALSSWNDTNTICDWLGVTCSGRAHPERVTGLVLLSLNLTGPISPDLANLTFLQTLNLSSNRLYGRIPPDLGRLSHLQYLDLRHNFFQGEIPSSLTHYCSNLRGIFLEANNFGGNIPANLSHCPELNIINFNYNQLTGTIPASLGSLPKLAKLGLYHNQLTGGIPPSFGNLSSLLYLDLSENRLEGRIPDALGGLTSLGFLDLELNILSGEIPPSLFNISSMYSFQVGNNSLSGTLPRDMGDNLPVLQFFLVFYNQLEGPLPVSLSNSSMLQWVTFHGNGFVGQMPPNLGSLPNLTALDVGLNQVEAGDWDFITSLSNCSNLQILHLSDNNFQGVIPNSVANLSAQLTWLAMATNQISGIIPTEIGKFTRLTVFNMAQNLLTGSIPPTIGMLRNLHTLDLSENQFHGELPSSLGNLTQLNNLLLGENRLQGNIPTSFGNLLQLGALNLSHNNLEGNIPGQALSLSSLSLYLDLSHNLLAGSLPVEVGSLKNLVMLDVSENRLSGEIPGSLGACQILGQLYMQGNLFQGTIPSALSSLKGIQALDLSRNNLSGQIPEFLESFQLLNHLNLSFNNLEGRVPEGGVFKNTSAISILGNNKLCGGTPELHLQSCDPNHGMSTRRSHRSLKVIISVVVAAISLLLLLLVCAVCYCIRKQRMKVPLPRPYLNEPFVHISYAEIRTGTAGFSSANLIGAGSFGSVYKGIMNSDSNQVFAIKVLNLEQRGAHESFIAECDSLRVIRHRNLVNIITVCSSVDNKGDDFKALVFEYMSNGSLDEWLHPRADEGRGTPRSLSLVQRWNIVMDVACALDYLHHKCQTPIVHCDLKPSNVLLDEDMSAHVGDFGLARFIRRTIGKSSQDPCSSIGIKGSIGYIAPEYGMGGIVSTQGDVYSYGVLLLETFTGKRPTAEMFQRDLNLHKYVEMAYPDRVTDTVDPTMLMHEELAFKNNAQNTTNHKGPMHEFMISIFKIGLLCSKESPNDRMEMGDVIKELLVIKKDWTHKNRQRRVLHREIEASCPD